MSEEVKDLNENPSAAEREEQVLENSGVKTTVEDGVYKVNLSNTQEDAIQEQETNASVPDSSEQSEESGQEAEVGLQEVDEQDQAVEQVIEEVTDEEPVAETTTEATEEVTKQDVLDEVAETPGMELPENIQKVVDFMNETGGTLEDYVRLNADYTNVDENSLLREYYKQKKSHLSSDEIDFLIEDKFSYDEEMDDERDIKRKKLAFKEEVAEARSFLNSLKDKYYEEVKLGSRLNPQQQEAIDFFNRYKQEQSELQQKQQELSSRFKQETDKVFNENFKGFDFKVGDKRFRFNVKDVQQTKEKQSDVMNVLGSFLDENNSVKDAVSYHKALFAASNADALANHFYEQGKADAIKQLNAESKNIDMEPRKTGVVDAGGMKVKAISGDDGSKLRIRLKQ